MKTRAFIPAGFGLLVVALFYLLAKTYWDAPSKIEVWSVDNPDQLLSPPTNGEPIRATFCLRNHSSRPLRVLGNDAC